MTSALAACLQSDWSGGAQVFRLTRGRRIGTKTEIEVVLGITSLLRQQAGPRHLLELIRAHWGTETACTASAMGRSKRTPVGFAKGQQEVMAALRNIVILFDRLGHCGAASATRHYVCHPEKSLKALAFPYSK
ncbi:MAG: hypothetical protein JOY71_29595 [Acetobacteraceae bacterium]|nr:hypothetical protein [Acetobacteraceae bacterium]